MLKRMSKIATRAPTLEDVAAHVNLSVATVGRALGGYGSVSPKAKALILRAAKELNYHPNAVARGMKEQRTKTIGLIVGNIMNPFFSTIVRAVEDTVSRHGFNLIVCNTDEDPQKELAQARMLFERRVDGLIVSPTVFDDRKALATVKQYYGKQIPTVFVDRSIKDIPVPSVFSDNVRGSYEATKHLIELGHVRIGVIVGKRSLTTMEGRIQGYKRALQEAELPFSERLIVDAASLVDVGIEGGYAATHALLSQGRDFSALLVCNNLLAVGTLRALKEAGVSIPRDLSFICWDDFELAEYLTPPLTVVNQAVYAMGSLAAERLINGLSSDLDLDVLEVTLKPQFIVRESTRAVSNVGTGATMDR